MCVYIYKIIMKTGVYLSLVGEKKMMGGLDLQTQTIASFLKSLQRCSPPRVTSVHLPPKDKNGNEPAGT